MNTQISFLVRCPTVTTGVVAELCNGKLTLIQEGAYTLIHIPLDLYPSLFQPIIRVLLPQATGASDSPEGDLEALTIDGKHGFLNVSITPIECSIVCHSAWRDQIFKPAVSKLPASAAKAISISKETYKVLSVISAGLDPAQRVMDLTSPLALAGISIFFISTYYSDFILVPTKERKNVTKALLEKGFELADNQADFTTPAPQGHKRATSDGTSPPNTPPPSDIAELQKRAFELLRKRNVAPRVDSDLKLIHCSGRETSQLSGEFSHGMHLHHGRRSTGEAARSGWTKDLDTNLYLCIVSALASQPRFMSITLAHEDPPSLLLDQNLLDIFGDAVVGDFKTKQIPIFLDLVNLPFDVAGIVCGVAGRVVQQMQAATSSELSYLSTARAGAVILPEKYCEHALDILRPLLSPNP